MYFCFSLFFVEDGGRSEVNMYEVYFVSGGL